MKEVKKKKKSRKYSAPTRPGLEFHKDSAGVIVPSC